MTTATTFALLILTACLCSMYVDQATAKYCKTVCNRKQRLEHVGYNAVTESIQIDKGECQTNFTIEDNCDLPTDYECTRDCEPRAHEIIPFSDRSGPKTATVIKSCYAPKHKCIRGCFKKPNFVILFSGSKYQQRIDIGKCVGQCQAENDTLVQCVSTRNITKAVEGPNGAVTLSVIKECSCASTACYRADHFESYTEVVTITATDNNTSTYTKTSEKLINVGRCIGSCPGVLIPGTCYPSPEQCLLYLNERPALCVPTEGTDYTFMGVDNKTRRVPAIVSCGCGTG